MRLLLTFPLAAILSLSAHAQLPADLTARIDAAAKRILKGTGVPSASVAIVKDGRVAYAQAYGLAHIAPDVPATPDMAYPIGSISKQFTASAMLVLQQEHKLSINDPVAKYFPTLTRASDITLRNLLTMTSGYEDYAPQDYIIPEWLKPVDPKEIVMKWATKPLDFEPGTQYQYSNTNFVLAALIVEKVSGEPFAKFLRDHVLTPAGLQGIVNTYTDRKKLRVTGYVSYALQPVHEQPLEGTNWYFGDGDLAMPASTLAAWDIVIMNRSLLTAESYRQFETAMQLKDGTDTGYGLGIDVHERTFPDGSRHLEFEHGGEVGGFVAENILYPEDKIAVVVLTNEVASGAASSIASAIKPMLYPAAASAVTPATRQENFPSELTQIVTGFQSGHIDQTLFTANCNSYFSPEALKDFQATFAPLGEVTAIKLNRTSDRGGMTYGSYTVTFSSSAKIVLSTYRMKNGQIEQLLVTARH